MIWFYERNKESIRIETRFDNDRHEYVIVVHEADGERRTERFADIEVFRARLLALEQRFEAERWKPTGTPIILPDGWPRRRPV